MRIAFLLLLLLNIVAFLWGRGYLGGQTTGREPERLAAQLKPDKLRILPPTPPAPPSQCQQVTDLDEAQLAQVGKLFSAHKDVELVSHERVVPGSYWVAIAALESRELAQRKQTELGKLGVTDGQLTEDARHGPFAIVLGSFTDMAAAQKLADELPARGVRSARLITRETAQIRYRVSLTWPETQAPARRESLTAWLAGLPAGHGVKLDACPVAPATP